jgi:hypothetical protein
VQQLIPGHNQLTAVFGQAVDALSPPVQYRVFWLAGSDGEVPTAFDYSHAEWADTLGHAYTIPNLVDGQHYWVAVRAFDSAPLPNLDQNRTVLGRIPGPRDVYPPHWPEGTEGISNVFFGNGQAVVSWPAAEDSTTDSFGNWSSGPANYRLYYGQGSTPDWTDASVIKIAGNGNPAYVRSIAGLDTSRPWWFAVRSSDRAEFPNEDGNTHVIVGWPTATHVVSAGYPGCGPGVADPLYTYPRPRLAYNPTRSQVRLCVESYSATQRYISVYRIGSSGFEHEADCPFAEVAANPQYKLHAVGLDAAGRLRLLYTRSRQFQGEHVLEEFSAASGLTTEYRITSGPDLLSAEYGPDGAVHGFWLSLTNPDLAHLQFTTYYSGLPFTPGTPVRISGEPPDDYYLTVTNYPWVWLADGSAATIGTMISLGSDESYLTAPTVSPDGTARLMPLHFPVLTSGMSSYRLVGTGLPRPIVSEWGESYAGEQLAQLRTYGRVLRFGNEPGFTQLCLASPDQGPALAATDWDNFAVARLLGTTYELGAAGAQRVYRCLDGSWQGRRTLIPLPQLAPDDACYPEALLPDGRVLCRVESAGGQRILLVDLQPPAPE